MRFNHLLLTIVYLLLLPASGGTVQFKAFNFSLESPSTWTSVDPPPDQTLGFFLSKDGSKGLIIIASKFSENQLATALEGMVSGAKKSASEKGLEIQNDRLLTIKGVPFHAFKTKLPDGTTIASYMGLAANNGYSLQVFSKASDPDVDDEILAAVNSFKLIDETKPPIKINRSSNEAYQFGLIAGRVAFAAFILGALLIILTKSNKTRREQQAKAIQNATTPESKPEGNDKPKTESDGHLH